jgi:carbamoyltransferase
MYTLGINAYHGDASACLYEGGRLIAATEEERIRRIKHWAGLPTEAVRFCLRAAGIGLEQVDYIALSRNPRARLLEKIAYGLTHPQLGRALGSRAANAAALGTLKSDLCQELGSSARRVKARVVYVEHHRAHLASAFMASPFEEAALLSVDGMGDFTSVMMGIGRGNRMKVLKTIRYPHSVGLFYTAITQHLGFPHFGDEYKVMGLAPYGEPLYADAMQVLLPIKAGGRFEVNPAYFRHCHSGVQMDWPGGAPRIGTLLTPAATSLLGPARQAGEPLSDHHRNLAASAQQHCESVVFHLAGHLRQLTGLDTLCLAGGVAQNSVANGKICTETGFKHLFVPPAAHDAGTAMGAALFHLHHTLKLPRVEGFTSPYTGADTDEDAIKALLDREGVPYSWYDWAALTERTAALLARGAVVGWYQGRAEFGPRALGNRSILASPAKADARERLNAKIKRRESFRPFAPAVLAEAVAALFEDDAPSPYMERVSRVRPEQQGRIPGAVHVDGSARLQTVDEHNNPLFYRLLKCFYAQTGVPALINTSFNENEPLVDAPKDALNCYLRTEMDALVLGRYLIIRS